MDDQEQRIKKILGDVCEVGEETASKYMKHLSNSIKSPCLLTGIEDFPWEEPYILGGGSPKEYEELKKENPSYEDKYELIELLKPIDDEFEILAKVKRINDNKIFKIGLSWLEPPDKNNPNYQLLYDYSVWHINY
ncbi:MAG: hypothetical protein ACE5D4_08465 [Thermodesulfobacteriota bacterium]